MENFAKYKVWLDKYFLESDYSPDHLRSPTFDPNVGFPNGRKERVMIAAKEELESAVVPQEQRDYCAHTFINYNACLKKNFPFLAKCNHELHEHRKCKYEDYVLRMKEYERERRLLLKMKFYEQENINSS